MRHSESHWINRGALAWLISDVVAPYLVTRTLLVLIGVIAVASLPWARNTPPGPTPYVGLNVLTRWDGEWYVRIMAEGYQYEAGEESSVAFAPLYPLLSRLVGFAFGGEELERWHYAGLLVSNVALLIALGYLSALVRLDYDPPTATRAAWYLCCFPASLFLSAIYTESLFLALAIAAFYYGRHGQWWLVGALGGLVALTRINGVAILIPLAVEYWVSQRGQERRIMPNALALGLIPVGFAVWAGYMQLHFGDPLIFLRAQIAWDRVTVWPWQTMQMFFSEPLTAHGKHSMLDLGFTVFYLMLVIASWRILRLSYAVYVTALFSLMLSSGLLISIIRYGLILFPLFIILALQGRRKAVDRTILIVSIGLAAAFMALFALRRWVA